MPDVKEKLLTGYQAGDTTFKVHLDGYNLMPYLKGETQTWPRREFLYWTDDGELAALRYDKWKALFLEQPAHGFSVWETPFVPLRVPKLFDLHADPFERAEMEVDRLLALADRPRLSADSGTSLCRAVADQLQAVSSAAEAGQLQPRSGDAADVGSERVGSGDQQVEVCPSPPRGRRTPRLPRFSWGNLLPACGIAGDRAKESM